MLLCLKLLFSASYQHLLEYSHVDVLMEGVIKQHRVLRGVAPCTAEEHYIQAAQQLDGYGQELFQAVVSPLKELNFKMAH